MSTSRNSITNLAELQANIRLLKKSIKESEADFNDRWARLPQETIKVTVGWIIPFLMKNYSWMTSGVWHVLKGVVPLFKRNKSKDGAADEDEKETVKGASSKLGVASILKTLYGFIKK